MDRQEQLTRLGNRLRELRLSKGLTQVELANKIGRDHPAIHRVETGKVNPSYLFLLEVCQGLEIELKELISV